MSVHDTMHQAIREVCENAKYPRVTYEGRRRVTSTREVVQPGSLKIKPLTSLYEEPRSSRLRRGQRERARMEWRVELMFDKEVSLEMLELDLSEQPIRLDPSNPDDPCIQIHLEEVDYRPYPPEHSGASGSRPILRLVAETII